METHQQSVSLAQVRYPSTQQNSNELALVPYAEVDGQWTLSDRIVYELGARAVAEGVLAAVFIHGNVQTPMAFLETMKEPTNLPVFVFKGTDPVGVAWLNTVTESHALGHFLYLREGRGEFGRKAGRLILEYWRSWAHDGERLIPVILGIVPSANPKAVQYAQDIGLTKLGEIPKMIHGRPATILYTE